VLVNSSVRIVSLVRVLSISVSTCDECKCAHVTRVRVCARM
jgi:hypothetical protein